MITARLPLTPATVALCEAEVRGPEAVSSVLQATMPQEWPPPVFGRDDVTRVHRQPTAAPSSGQWTLYYVLRRSAAEEDRPALVGIAGYVAPPPGGWPRRSGTGPGGSLLRDEDDAEWQPTTEPSDEALKPTTDSRIAHASAARLFDSLVAWLERWLTPMPWN